MATTTHTFPLPQPFNGQTFRNQLEQAGVIASFMADENELLLTTSEVVDASELTGLLAAHDGSDTVGSTLSPEEQIAELANQLVTQQEAIDFLILTTFGV